MARKLILPLVAFALMGKLTGDLSPFCTWQVPALCRSFLALVFAAMLARAGGARLVLWRPGILWLRSFAGRHVPMVRRTQWRKRHAPPHKPSLPPGVPYQAILRSLRGHGSVETESFLVLAAHDWDPLHRAAAVSSLGWWEPLRRQEVLYTLQEARRDACPEVRQAARAALARLGERQALQWFRQTLASEDPHRVHETIQTIATESLTLLWPDLDRLADAEDGDVAQLAREALERLCEEMETWRN